MVIFIAVLVNVYTLEERRNVDVSCAILCYLSFTNLCIFLIGGTIGIVFDVIDNILYFSHEK